ncbi:MAG: histone family protein [Nanoarchaeota archaeon]
MAKRENILPYAPIGNLISKNTGKRVSKEARKTATQILEELTQRIIKKAVLLAENSGRKTLQEKDILLAFNQLKGGLK